MLRGLLLEPDLAILCEAYTHVYWVPLSTIIRQYVTSVINDQYDPVAADELAAAYAWRPAAAAMEDEVTGDPAHNRKVLSSGRIYPPAAGAWRDHALIWFYPLGLSHTCSSWFALLTA